MQEPSKAHAAAAHHLLRLAAPRVARNPQHAPAMEVLENLTLGKDRGAGLAALWSMASMARHAEEPRRSMLSCKVVDVLAKAAERDAKDGPEGVVLYAALSACLALGPANLALSQVRGQLWPAVLKCFGCGDAVGVRHALLLLLDRAAAEPGGVNSIVQGLLHTISAINLRDPLARVYMIQLCALDLTPLAMQHVEKALEDVSFRVVSEALAVLCAGRLAEQLPLAKMVAPVVAAFQSPRPVLHFSALRACALLGRCTVRGKREAQVASLVPLVMVQAQNDSPFHRWRALMALVWLATDPATVTGPIATELRLAELAGELVQDLYAELTARAAVSGPVWGDALLSSLTSWLFLAPKSLGAALLLRCWNDTLLCGVAPAAVLASVVMFVQHEFPPNRSEFAAQLHENAAVFFGNQFALLSSSDNAVSSMVVFLEGLVLGAGSRAAVQAMVQAAKAPSTSAATKERIRAFLALFRADNGFASELCEYIARLL